MAKRFEIAKKLGIFISFCGLAVMFGWFFDIQALKSILPFWVTMKFSIAFCFLLSGISLYLIAKFQKEEETITELNRSLINANRELEAMALKDLHTGLYNHRYLEDAIEAEFSRAKRSSSPLSVIMMDIDYFKSINDVYGHQFGDIVLKQLADHIKTTVRQYDIVIRFAGEEFVAMLPDTDETEGLILAKRILEAVNLRMFGNEEHSVKIKLSMGVAAYPDDNVLKGMELISAADKALSRVKEDGGNKAYSSSSTKGKKMDLPVKAIEAPADISLMREKIDKLTRSANQNVIEAIFAFAKTIEIKDHYTGTHVEKTVHYAEKMAEAAGLPSDEIERIKQSAALHDLGKIGISEKILLKPGKLTKEEFDEIKKHPQIGVDIIRPIHFMHDLIPLMLHHHEMWDGKGYPDGLKGEETPVGARIIAIADAYDALTSDRPYRKAFAVGKAIEIIKEGSGTQFDPKLIAIFLDILKKEPVDTA